MRRNDIVGVSTKNTMNRHGTKEGLSQEHSYGTVVGKLTPSLFHRVPEVPHTDCVHLR